MAVQIPAMLAMDGGDPRLSDNGEGIAEFSRSFMKNIHDSSVPFEEFLYYAKISREEEKGISAGKHPLRMLAGFGKKKTPGETVNAPSTEKHDEKEATDTAVDTGYKNVTDEEWYRAARAARTATWGAVFYLVTTDILGPFSVPWALYRMGWGPGVILYFIFACFAIYSGFLIWKMFLGLDSTQFPVKTYSDLGFRVYGTAVRHALNAFQSIQLLFNVGIIVIGNGQGLSQVNSKICYIICCFIWVICGMVVGQIRTLQRFGWIANLAIWLNVTVMIITMAAVSNSPPNYGASYGQNGIYPGHFVNNSTTNKPLPGNPAPKMTTASAPPGTDFTGQIVGLMQAVYSYGGAMLFTEFMSEMRKPYDFWKAMIASQGFIFVVYIFFGTYVYGQQGQYVINPANQGISNSLYGAQTAGNIISFVSAIIAAALYGNIGIKVLYVNIFKDIFGLPDLTSKTGKIIWVFMVPVYWAIAFIIAAAIPNFSALVGLVGAIFLLQFTYTFPPLIYLGYKIKLDAIQDGEGFNPTTGQVVRHDNGMKRWLRGARKNPLMKLFYLFYFLGALATCILGTYSSVLAIIQTFQGTQAKTSFSCTSPLA